MPEARFEVVIASGRGATTRVSETDFLCEGLDESTSVAVKFVLPIAVGVPEISPVEAERLSPFGRPPDVIDHA